MLWKTKTCLIWCKWNKFTWSNKHSKYTFTKERLDKAIAKNPWRGCFKEAWVEGLTARSLDHKPILLSMYIVQPRYKKRNKLFRFEASWIKNEECEKLIM